MVLYFQNKTQSFHLKVDKFYGKKNYYSDVSASINFPKQFNLFFGSIVITPLQMQMPLLEGD
jgi:hypothetical protein